VLKTLFFLHTHWARISQGGDDLPSCHQLAVLAYHVRGLLRCWLLDGEATLVSPELFLAVESACKTLEALEWAFNYASRDDAAREEET
jgi:hypothetical protein